MDKPPRNHELTPLTLEGAREALVARLEAVPIPAAERRRALRLMALGGWLTARLSLFAHGVMRLAPR